MVILPYVVVKMYGSLRIVDQMATIIYTLPFFLRQKLKNRDQLQWLCDKFNDAEKRDIYAIIEFETAILDNKKLNGK